MFLAQVLGALLLMVFLLTLYKGYKKDNIWAIFKASAQYWASIVFVSLALLLMSGDTVVPAFIAVVIFSLAGFLIFPPINRFLPPSPMKHPLIISCAALLFTLGPLYAGNEIQTRNHEKAKAEAMQEFARASEIVLEGIRADAEGKRYEAVVDKAGLLLDTDNPEIEKLYAEATEMLHLRKMRASAQERNTDKKVSKKQGSSTKKTEAYYMCKHFIKEKLNDPKSLDFPDSNTAHITSNGDTYDIAGTFRANNAFGAKMQSSYACTVTEKPSRGTWTLDYLSEF